jgi:hypothetical protein
MSSVSPNDSSPKSAWVQLYEARRMSMDLEVRIPGRPPGPIPRRKVGMTLSQGEISELEVWQDRFSSLLHRKVSVGETVGLLARICTTRYASLPNRQETETLVDLVERMIGQE